MAQVAITEAGREAIARRAWVSALRAVCDVTDAQVLEIEAAYRVQAAFQKEAASAEGRWVEAKEAAETAQKRWELANHANEQMAIKVRSLEKELLDARMKNQELAHAVRGEATRNNELVRQINSLPQWVLRKFIKIRQKGRKKG